ncbi:MAG: F0F1 ATP synthase subunit delta [Acidimicrobiales bacterium]
MHERVLGYADAVLDRLGPGVGPAAVELEAFSRFLAGSDDLRGALGSPTTPAPVRRTIVQELLTGKISAPALELLSSAAEGGAAPEYAEDVESLAELATSRRDGRRADEGPLGRSAAGDRIEGYATAVLKGLDERQLANVEDELFRFMRIVEGNDDLRTAMATAELPAQARQSVVEDLLGRHASPESARLASYAARVGRPRDYLLLLDRLVQRVAREADRRVADVRSAVEMTEAERSRLAAALSRLTGYQVEVRVSAEPELLGGFVATVGDTVVDASLRRSLERARELLTAPGPAPGSPAPAGGWQEQPGGKAANGAASER